MSEFIISTRYANALLELSQEKNTFETAFKDISLIKNTLNESKELRNFLANPVIKTSDKSEVLKEMFGNRVSSDVTNFMLFLIKKGREGLLSDICGRFISLSNEKLNQIDVSITSAIELNDKQKDEIKNKLESMINKTIIPSFEVDNKIIGGFKARFNDTVVDATIKHQLELLRKQLFEENYLKN